MNDRPINPLELMVCALPRNITQDKLKILFPNASNIKLMSKFKNKR